MRVFDWVPCILVVGMRCATRLEDDLITEILFEPTIVIGSLLFLIYNFISKVQCWFPNLSKYNEIHNTANLKLNSTNQSGRSV